MLTRIIGKKLGMTRYFIHGGKSVPVTVFKAGPCVVTQKKTVEKNGYNAIQVGYEPKKESKVNKPLKGNFSAAGTGTFSYLKEIRVEDPEGFELGQIIKTDIFSIGDLVQVIGKSKGKGFSGVIKRWGFSGGRKTHGSRSHRIPGSIGCSATPGRVRKGAKLPGRSGDQRVTIKNLEVIDIRHDTDVIMVKGSAPGSKDSLVEICKI